MRAAAELLQHRYLLLVALLVLGGCASTVPECSHNAFVPDCFGSACAGPEAPLNRVPPGSSHACVIIDSQPTSAAIYIDGDYIGTTPLEYSLWFESNTRYIRVLAQPMYANQAPQERLLQVPPVPRRLQFFMNNPNRTNFGSTDPGQGVPNSGAAAPPEEAGRASDAGQ